MKPIVLPTWAAIRATEYRGGKTRLLSMFALVTVSSALSLVAILAIAGCNLRGSERASASIKVSNTAEAAIAPNSVAGASVSQSNADIESTAEGISTATSTPPPTPPTATASAVVVAAATEAAIAIPCDAVIVPTRSAAVYTRVAARTPQDQIAPSYWEIRRTEECIINAHPMPLSKHIQEPEQFYDYKFHVIGMRVEGWEGWIKNDAFREDIPENTYRIRVYMVIPREADRSSYYPSNLYGLTEAEVTKLKQWQASRPNIRWHKVSFSGIIMSIGGGEVFISNPKIIPIEE